MTLLGFAGIGTAKADPACIAATFQYYITNFATGCTYDGLNFSGFGAGASGVSSSGTTSISGMPGPNTQYLEITPFVGSDGAGLEFTMPGGWTAKSGGVLDAEVPFEVSCASGTACITDIYQQIDGSVTGNLPGNEDALTELYCVGASSTPPSCVNAPQALLTLTGSQTTKNNTILIAGGTSQIAIGKDMGANANGSGYPQGTSTITDVINEFSTSTPPPTTPEPSSLLMLGAGVMSLLGYGLRRRGISQQ